MHASPVVDTPCPCDGEPQGRSGCQNPAKTQWRRSSGTLPNAEVQSLYARQPVVRSAAFSCLLPV